MRSKFTTPARHQVTPPQCKKAPPPPPPPGGCPTTFPTTLDVLVNMAFLLDPTSITGQFPITITDQGGYFYLGYAASWIDTLGAMHPAEITGWMQWDPSSCNWQIDFVVLGQDPDPDPWIAHFFNVGVYSSGSPINFFHYPLAIGTYTGGGSFDI